MVAPDPDVAPDGGVEADNAAPVQEDSSVVGMLLYLASISGCD